MITFTKRLGPDPHADGMKTAALSGCPDVWELSDGDFAVIGIDITDACLNRLPATAGCGPDERIVRVSRRIFVGAKPDIPDAV